MGGSKLTNNEATENSDSSQPTPKKVSRNTRNYMALPFNPALKARAKELRKAGNLPEVLFWNQVKNKQFKGLDFDRQKIIGNYIVDFYCANCNVVVEIDGSSHNDKQEYDAQRDRFLESLGLTVIHISVSDVMKQMESVMRMLDAHPVFLRPPRPEDAQERPPRPEDAQERPPRPEDNQGSPPRPADAQERPPRPSDTPPEEGNLKGNCLGNFGAMDVLDYIYAVLHSPSYRAKYNEFLKIDFPRVPYPKDVDTFWKLVRLGSEIRQIHLLESQKLEEFTTEYPVDGDNVVGKPEYKNGKVFINDLQYFDNVPEIAWNFYIGGYQPAQKWLKDRKNRKLDFDDILHYQKIIMALSETDRLMKEIDRIEI